MNTQTPGPLLVAKPDFEEDICLTSQLGNVHERFILARVNRYTSIFNDDKDLASAVLLARSYTAFDKAGRALNLDAAELAEKIDLVNLLSALYDARESLSRLPNAQGAYRVSCIEQIEQILRATGVTKEALQFALP